MADRPLAQLGGKTCLQTAHTPVMDRLASCSRVGRVRTVPVGMPAGSDVANLSIFGYDPKICYTGRAPLEAASMGVHLEPEDVAFRCNLVSVSGPLTEADSRMLDYSGGHITTDEARPVIETVNKALGTELLRFHPGVSYRHLMVWKKGSDGVQTTPPHDILGQKLHAHLPRGSGEDTLVRLMNDSQDILMSHPVVEARLERGLGGPNSIWFWGQGRRPEMPGFLQKYGKSGAIISAVDLTKGIGVFAGFEVINVPGATGYLDTNYAGKASAALEALDRHDLVYVHVEAPDEAGHNGKVEDKIRAIEDFDAKIVGPIVEGMSVFGDYRVLVLPDHPTPLEIRTHSAEPVPFILHQRGDDRSVRRGFDETITGQPELDFEEGHRLMGFFLGVEQAP